MTTLHPVLARQLAKLGVDVGSVSPALVALFGHVSRAYADGDRERARLERAVAMCSEEMLELNASLAEERDRLRAIFQATDDAVCVLDERGQLTMLNPAAERLLEAPASELLGAQFVAFVEGGDLPTTSFHSESFRMTSTRRRAFDVSITFTPLSHLAGSVAGSVAIFRDVSERQRAEEAVRASEARFRAIFSNAAVGIVSAGPDTLIFECNDTYARMLGYERHEILGCSWRKFSDPDERVVLDAMKPHSSAPKTYERSYIHKDGSRITATVTLSLIENANGESFHLAVVRDITAQRQLELSLRHAQRLEAVGRLAAGVAHEINTPIQFIGDNLTFLSSSIETVVAHYGAMRSLVDSANTDELARLEEANDVDYLFREMPRAIADSSSGAMHVGRIVHAMNAFAHIDRSDHPARVDLNAALESVVTVAHNETKYVADVILELGDVEPILGFQGDLSQVFLNLLVNAAHAVGDVVSKTDGRGRIVVRTRRDNDAVVVDIEDSGTGIPLEVRDHVFDPFFTTKEVGRGTGQGLALARSIVVNKHHGDITFDTELGRGTTFHVRLPRDCGQKAA